MLNLNGALVAAESLTRILTSPALVLPVPAPNAIPVEPVPFSLAASINCVYIQSVLSLASVPNVEFVCSVLFSGWYHYNERKQRILDVVDVGVFVVLNERSHGVAELYVYLYVYNIIYNYKI